MLKKSFLIITPILLVIGLIFAYGIKSYNSRYVTFQADGHIFAEGNNKTVKKYFFDTNSKYKQVDDNVIITTNDNKSITVPSETFIHYSDGSISTFSKSVVLNLDDITKNSDTYKYYNVFPGTIFVKSGSDYSINYLDSKLRFKNLLLKINDNKFMIVGDKINLRIGDNEKKLDNTYLEVTYLDGNVIKINNQSVSFQSVSDEVLVEMGDGTIIDFVNKDIYKDRVKKLALGEMTIDSDDNITISTEDNKSITGEKDKGEEGEGEDGDSDSNSSSKSNQNSGVNGNDNQNTREQLPNVNPGVVDTTTDSIEEVVDANARVKDAEFQIVNMDVNANHLVASVSITDTAAVLTGPINIKIIEAGTNKIVYETNDESGYNLIDIENETLVPETNYILVMNSDYVKNNVTYNKDFIQKTFITDSIGVTLEKYFVSDNQLQVNVKKSSYSDVASVDVALEDNEEKTLKTLTVPLEVGDNIVSFTPLENNTNYKVRVYNFVYQDSIVTDGFTILKKYETLKKKPTIGETTFEIDKKEGKFNMHINNMLDPDGGVISYKYEVYDAREVNNNPSANPITIIEKSNSASASLKVNNSTISRGVPYVFRVVMTFNDNEKEYDYTTELSEVMKMDGVSFPIIKFNKTEVTFERIVGDIEIVDPDNTINLNDSSIIKVTYTSSVGESKTITSSGSLVIPITEAVGLRANETYTFSVMATVDLQDGNPPIDSCYIGSVIVKTEDPNPFKMEYNQIEDPAHVFTIDAQLLRKAESTELEANTLTGITFNLYQGKGTAGKLVKSITHKDLNDDHYQSDLRVMYYDQQFRIDPSFFGLRNSDLTAEYYTIETTAAYDYTIHPNYLPIENNTITTKSANALPDMPPDPTDSIDFIPISNRDHEKREDLNDGTTVGYNFRAAYNNDAKYAKRIVYKIHDATTDAVIDTIEYTVPVTGEINYSQLFLNDGIASRESDGTLRRGQPFYISYTIELDTNYDDIVDLVYPLEGAQLRSRTIAASRQEPTVNLYPSKSTANSYTWKYTRTDVDHTLLDNKVYAYVDGEKVDTKTMSITKNYTEVTFNNIRSGLFAIYGNYNLVNTSDPSEYSFVSQYYEGVTTNLDFGRVSLATSDNRVIFSFLDYEAKEALFDKVSNIKIDFTSGNKTITVNSPATNSGMITVSYSTLEQLMGLTITPTITLYYDSGVYGFDNTGDAFAVQQVRSTVNDRYYYYYENGTMKSSLTASGSYLNYSLNFDRKKITFTNKFDNSTYESSFFINHFGLNFDSNYISPKKLNSKTASIIDNTTFSFDEIIPGVSLLDTTGKSTISPLIDSVNFKITPYIGDDQLQNNKVYIEVYKTLNDSGSEAELIGTSEYSISALSEYLKIEGLLPQTNYYFMVYGNVKNASGTYEKKYLYDVDQQKNAVHYYFKTIGNIGISNISARYAASKYDRRYFYLTYRLAETIGYTYIKYNVYKIIDNSEEILMDQVVSTNATLFNTNMNAYIIIPNTSGVVTSNRYRIEIQPVLTTTVNGQQTDILLESASVNYTFNDLYKPHFVISKSAGNNALYLRVNVKDYHKSIDRGKYTIQMLDSLGNDITPTQYRNQEYDITTVNQSFDITNFSVNTRYQLVINYNCDIHNDSSRITTEKYSYTFAATPMSDVVLGDVYADTAMNDNTKVNIRFFGSYQLTKIKTIRYSIYNESGYSVDNQAPFTPSLIQTDGTSYYEYQLPTSINTEGIYYISMQFVDADGKTLAEETVEYRLF